MYLYIIALLFIIIIIILIIFFNNKQIESFSCPSERTGYICNLDNKQYGICDRNLNCIPFVEPVVQVLPTTISAPTSSAPTSAPTSPPQQPDTCINNGNFDTICKSFNSNYGIKSINTQNCNPGYSEVVCGDNYINGVDYSNNKINNKLVKTPCLNKNIDFDTMCKYYNTESIPSGYTIDSIGASEILIGKSGDCYLNNGNPNPNSARAVCNYNNIGTVPKLNRAFNKLNYNKFTECNPIKSEFNTLCSTVLNSDNVKAIQIMGYDCLPGYARAKCVYNNDLNNNNNDLGYFLDGSDSSYFSETSSSSFSKCNC
jgi:hypothetical protein